VTRVKVSGARTARGGSPGEIVVTPRTFGGSAFPRRLDCPPMTTLDVDRLLALLRDPNVESQEIAAQAGVPREEVGRASRLLHGLARANPEEVTTLPAPLASALLRASHQAGRADVLAALAGHASKEVSKEAKRALHLLRARGVAVPEPPRPPAPAPAAPPEPPLPSYATVVDGHGERAVWLARSVPGKGIEIAQAVVSDTRGLLEAQVGMLGRKEWRAFAKGLLERGAAMGVAEIDRERAKGIVSAARALNDASGQRVPEGADLWLARVGPGVPPPDPAEGFPPLADDAEREALAASGALHDLPLLRGWLADEDTLRQLAAKLDEISVSPLYIDDRQRAEQMARTLSDAVETYFDAPRRAALAGRLFAVAEHLRASGDEPHARSAAAAARALRAGTPPAAVPFARLLVEKAFPPPPPPRGAPDERPGEPDAPPSPLIVAPR
jgi:hypothetical protein